MQIRRLDLAPALPGNCGRPIDMLVTIPRHHCPSDIDCRRLVRPKYDAPSDFVDSAYAGVKGRHTTILPLDGRQVFQRLPPNNRAARAWSISEDATYIINRLTRQERRIQNVSVGFVLKCLLTPITCVTRPRDPSEQYPIFKRTMLFICECVDQPTA